MSFSKLIALSTSDLVKPPCIVLGFELRKDLDFFVTPLNVEYQDKYDVLDYLKDPEKSTIDTLKLKSSQWEYEAEVRVYKDSSGLYPIDALALSDVYFGLKTTHKQVGEIIETCKQKQLDHITFHQAKKVHGEFKLSFDQLN